VAVGLVPADSQLEIIGEVGNWFEISHNGGLAYIASWLTFDSPQSSSGRDQQSNESASSKVSSAVKQTADTDDLEILFRIISHGANVRRCPGTSCNPPVGVSQVGQVFEVVDVTAGDGGEWYQILFQDSTAYIAGWLTTKTVDATATYRAAIDTSIKVTSDARSRTRSRNTNATSTARARKTENAVTGQTIETGGRRRIQFRDRSNTLCYISPTENKDGSNVVVIAGNRKYSAEVKVTLPNKRNPVGVAKEVVDEVSSGESGRYIFLKNANEPLQPGIYTLKLEIAGTYYSTIYWRVRKPSRYAIAVVCASN